MKRNDRLLRMTEVVEIVELSSSTIYRYMAKGMFPRSRRIGPNSVRWLESEVREWMESRPPNGEDPDGD